jgi:hypothetical protein
MSMKRASPRTIAALLKTSLSDLVFSGFGGSLNMNRVGISIAAQYIEEAVNTYVQEKSLR